VAVDGLNNKKGNKMNWIEVNCILEALDALIEKYQAGLNDELLSEDEHSELSNDLAYCQILKGKYDAIRTNLSTI
jgi:hypothetical protein